MAESNKKPRAERTKNNRELILEKSVELFRDKGYEQTTMADISRATGLTNGSIYPLMAGCRKSLWLFRQPEIMSLFLCRLAARK